MAHHEDERNTMPGVLDMLVENGLGACHRSRAGHQDLPRPATRFGTCSEGIVQIILDRFKLTNRVAIITGADKGIGRGIALAFAEAGRIGVLGGVFSTTDKSSDNWA